MNRLAVDERVGGPETFVSRVGDAVPFVEALIGREAPFGMAQMPLAVGRGRIALGRQCFGNGDFPLRQTIHRRVERHRAVAGTHGIAPGQQRRPAGRALCLDVEIGEPHAFLRQRIEARRGRTAGDAAAVDAELAVAQVVHQHQHDIRLAGGSPYRGRGEQQGDQQQTQGPRHLHRPLQSDYGAFGWRYRDGVPLLEAHGELSRRIETGDPAREVGQRIALVDQEARLVPIAQQPDLAPRKDVLGRRLRHDLEHFGRAVDAETGEIDRLVEQAAWPCSARPALAPHPSRSTLARCTYAASRRFGRMTSFSTRATSAGFDARKFPRRPRVVVTGIWCSPAKRASSSAIT